MVAIYTRVSTQGQADNYSMPAQIRDGEAFAESKGLPFRHFQDVASGGDITRAGILKLQEALKEQTFEYLWVGEIDRLSRGTIEGMTVVSLLRDKGTLLVAGGATYDARDHGIWMILTVLFAVAEGERHRIKKRTGNGRVDEINAGKRRFCYVYGYRFGEYDPVSGKRKIEVEDNEAEIVRLVYRFYREGQSFTDITRFLNEHGFKPKKTGWVVKEGKKAGTILHPKFDANTVSKILHRPEYIGLTHNKAGELITSVYPPILDSVPEWEKIQGSIEANTLVRVRKHIKSAGNLLTGLLRCPHCGSGYFFHKSTNRHKHGGTYSTYMHKAFTEAARACTNRPKNFVSQELEAIVNLVYETLMYNKEDFLTFVQTQKTKILLNIQEIQNQIVVVETQLEESRIERTRLTNAVLKGIIEDDAALGIKKELDIRESEIKAKIGTLRAEERHLTALENEALIGLQEEEFSNFERLSIKQKRDTIGSRLSMEVNSGILTITSLIGSQYIIQVDQFKKRCDSTKEELRNNPRISWGKFEGSENMRTFAFAYLSEFGKKPKFVGYQPGQTKDIETMVEKYGLDHTETEI